MPLLAIRQPENPRDPNAIGLWVQGKTRRHQIGFIKSGLAEELGEHLDEGAALTVRVLEVTGGGKGQSLGVNIEITVHGLPGRSPVHVHKHVVEHIHVEERTRKQGGCLSSCGSLGCLIVTGTIIALAVVITWTPRSERPIAPNIAPAPPPVRNVAPAPLPARNVASKPQDKPTDPKTGDVVVLVNDELKVVSIIYEDAFLHLPNPTRVRVIDGKPRTWRIMGGLIEVEVLDGEHRGKRGLAHPNAMRRIGSNLAVQVKTEFSAEDVRFGLAEEKRFEINNCRWQGGMWATDEAERLFPSSGLGAMAERGEPKEKTEEYLRNRNALYQQREGIAAKLVAQKYGIPVDIVKKIDEEGVEKKWIVTPTPVLFDRLEADQEVRLANSKQKATPTERRKAKRSAQANLPF
jgi:hypothetical protein